MGLREGVLRKGTSEYGKERVSDGAMERDMRMEEASG